MTGCAYGAPTKKPYRLWMTPATRQRYTKVRIQPQDKASLCKICKGTHRTKKRHDKTVLPAMGDKRARSKEKGLTVKAARNRVPALLAEAVGRCMLEAYEST